MTFPQFLPAVRGLIVTLLISLAISCKDVELNLDIEQEEKLPLISLSQFEYAGGFRVSGATFGDSNRATTSYSRGIFTYNPDKHSIFIMGHPQAEMIGEFIVPDLVKATDIEDFNQVDEFKQKFVQFHQTDRIDTGIASNTQLKVAGLAIVDDALLVNYVTYYDAQGTETDTTIVFTNSNDLANSEIKGPFQLEGAGHAAGWISPIPKYWQARLDGTYIAGAQSGTPIKHRQSVGPAAFSFYPEADVLERDGGEVKTTKLLDFPLEDFLYNKAIYGDIISGELGLDILIDFDGNNDLWNHLTGASYGFIVPGTATYVTVGNSGGKQSGIGYKNTQLDGTLCGGYCAYDPDDYYSYYWLWDVYDLIKVKRKILQAHEVRPYEYGQFPVPVEIGNSAISGGSFDASSNLLYLSFQAADTIDLFARPPVFLAYKYTPAQTTTE